MTGIFHRKYRVAVYDEDPNFIDKVVKFLKSWFRNKISVESYTDSHEMFININVAKAKNRPFDMTIVGPAEGKETTVILKNANPSMKIINYKDETTLKKDTAKFVYYSNKPLIISTFC